MTTYGPNHVAEKPIQVGPGNEWADLENMVGPPDGSSAAALVAAGEQSKRMVLNFGLVPGVLRAPVSILANITAQSVDGNSTLNAQLYVGGVPVGAVKSVAADDTGGSFALYSLGGDGDAWGANLNGVDAANVRLGIWFSDTPNDGGAIVAAGDATNLTLTDTDPVPKPARRSRLTRVKRLQRFFRV